MIRVLILAVIAGLVAESSQRMSGSTAEPVSKDDTNIRAGGGPECWTHWFDRDNPSGTGDWETLSLLQQENPNQICDHPTGIQVKTYAGLTPAQVGDNIHTNDAAHGFVCRNEDQDGGKMCADYRVRFLCHLPHCEICLTPWYDRDNPSGTGDWELLSTLREENPGQICEHPQEIEAVTTDTGTDAGSTGETFAVNSATDGLVCKNSDQSDGRCRDYKVRFGCSC